MKECSFDYVSSSFTLDQQISPWRSNNVSGTEIIENHGLLQMLKIDKKHTFLQAQSSSFFIYEPKSSSSNLFELCIIASS